MVSGWDMSRAKEANHLFQEIGYYANQAGLTVDFSVSDWDVSNMTTMEGMFSLSPDWNNGGSPGISGWDTSNCTSMQGMFSYGAFNQPIGSWDTSSVTSISNMFQSRSYGHDLSNWVVTGLLYANNFLGNHSNGMSTSNYSSTLIGWGAQSVQNGVNIGFGNSKYSAGAASSARQSLVNQGWTITDGGQA